MRIDGLPDSLTQPPTAAPTTAAPKDEFLKLLVAQLSHQDPMQPQDGSAFVAQLAQFASLEQAAETNQRLADLQAGQAASTRAGMTDVVGRTASARADAFHYDPASGALPPTTLHLDGAASGVTVIVRDAEGREVRRLELGARPSGETPLAWDGLDAAGRPLGAGDYQLEVQATAPTGGPVPAYATFDGLVTGLLFEDGGSQFLIGGATLAPAAITSIRA